MPPLAVRAVKALVLSPRSDALMLFAGRKEGFFLLIRVLNFDAHSHSDD